MTGSMEFAITSKCISFQRIINNAILVVMKGTNIMIVTKTQVVGSENF